MRHGEATHAVGSSTVLVRRGEGEFTFIHQSVWEWLVARWAVTALADDAGDRALADHELTSLMADFLCDLAGEDPVIGWARRMVRSADVPGPAAKANAVLILRRRQVTVTGADYAGQDLQRQDLTGQDLSGARLDGADLSGAVLPQELRGATLREARLVGVRADRTDLTGADLTGADLTGASLLGANLSNARLHDARLDRAVLLGATLDADAAVQVGGISGAALPGSRVVPQLASSSGCTAVAHLEGGALLMTGHRDGTVRLWDPTTGAALRTLEAHTGRVRALAADPTGGWLAAAGDDDTVRLWDPTTGAALRTLEAHTGWVRALAADPTGGWLASAGDDGTVRLWDPTTGAPLATLVGSADGWAALLPDGSYKLSGDPGGLWWVAGLCRFEPRELDNLAQFVSSLRRLPDDALIDHVR